MSFAEFCGVVIAGGTPGGAGGCKANALRKFLYSGVSFVGETTLIRRQWETGFELDRL
jgi:hypothetical protein